MKAELKTITPDWASEILETKNTRNRPLNARHVERLSKEIRNGNWKVNGDTICLNGDRLIDGQHRLAAVVATGISISSFVIEGIPSDVFDTKDVGRKRTAGDTLGVLGEKNSYRLAACLTLIEKYMTGRVDNNAAYSNTEIEELLRKYPLASQSLQTNHPLRGIIPPSVVDTCFYLFSQKDPALAQQFVEKVCRGSGLEEGHPWYVLRERLLSNSLSKAKMSKAYMFALCIKAWNHSRAGSRIKFLRFREKGDSTESFPVVQ